MRYVKKLKRVTASLLAICLIFSCFSISAFATVATGTTKNVTVNGYSYTYFSRVENMSTQLNAFGIINSNVTVPTGYMAIEPRLYEATSSRLVEAGAWYYNQSPIAGMAIGNTSTTASGTFYAHSRMLFYNGNSYDAYTSYASPRVQRSSSRNISKESFEVNEMGLTYGSDMYSTSIEDSPDLISAIGVNGIEGYIYAKDLNPKLNTLAEVLDYIDSGVQDYTVLVYDEDGITVVDTFEVKASLEM